MANPNPSPKDRIRSGIEAEKKGRKGGKASGRTRRAMKTFKEALQEALTPEQQKVMNDMLVRNAMRGNLPAYEFLLKMLGQHPEQDTATDHNITISVEGFDGYGD